MTNNEPVGFAALWGMIHILRALVNRGLISPAEVDEIYGSMIEGFQSGDARAAAFLEQRLEQPFAELRQWAEKNWIGKGQTNPG
ncbi:MAG TPA: hypothetical protein VGF77_13835 [Allosphingosinicella sp.]|jgi:hypothetical protein